MLFIHLLESFSANVDGHSVGKWPRKSALHLLQALALSPDYRVSRTQLAETLVPDGGSEQLRTVSDALYALRRQPVIDHPSVSTLAQFVKSSPEAIWLDKINCFVDVTDFESAADHALNSKPSVEQLSDVVARCGGPLLPDVAPPLDAIITSLRPVLEQKYLACARALVMRHVDDEQSERAILALQSVLRVAPDDEESHRQLIELFAKLGRYHEAEQQLALCRHALARDLGIRPSDTTINAIRVAREQRVSTHGNTQTDTNDSSAIRPTSAHTTYSPPKPLVKLIGREGELASLSSILTLNDRDRLITLCGVGGVGKTQLALEIASRIGSRFRNGSAFIDLTKAPDEAAAVRLIAMTLGLKREPNRSWKDQLQCHLKNLNLLVVLDNFEHVYRMANWLALLVEQCPELVALCTSRVPLLVRGEFIFDVAPLSLVPADREDENTEASDAAQLFVRAARQALAGVSHNMAMIESLCKRLDGLPLAIEFAAARSAVVGVPRLLEEVSTSVALLDNPIQNAPLRHASLQTLLTSICEVLDERSRQALDFAAYFESGFTVQHFVASELFAPGESEALIARLLNSRIVALDNSDQIAVHGTNPLPRFRLLETVRSFVRHSSSVDVVTNTTNAHGYIQAWYAFAQEVRSARSTPREREMFDAFEREFENVSSAIRLAARVAPAMARSILVALWRVFVRRSHLSAWLAWAENGLLSERAKTKEEVELLVAACEVYRAAAQYPKARQCGEAAVAAMGENFRDKAAAYYALACANLIQGEYSAGSRYLDEAFAACLVDEDNVTKLDVCVVLSTMNHRLGRFTDAARHANEAKRICDLRRIEPSVQLVGNLALSLRFAGNLCAAVALYESAANRCHVEREARAEAIMRLDLAECKILALDLHGAHETLATARTLVEQHHVAILECVLFQQEGALAVLRTDAMIACAALEKSMCVMPSGSYKEQADLTLLWYVHAELLAGDIAKATDLAVRLTSSEVKVRRYVEPFVLETVACLFVKLGSRDAAMALMRVAAAARHRDGLNASPAEVRLLRQYLPVTEVDSAESVVAPNIDSALRYCNDLLHARKVVEPRTREKRTYAHW